ncbi:uncharacterized protein LOC109140645 isoform X2 [Larimichthys crocea]|uniref:uncharacterized protein LOC109140645 isoform X2 n=1 Tax=Larimichthys crocea TaxID=215358 RepID=UPI000F5EE43E|nr:uncharacterized protein LOC109140645 isoform X2 [Larimichthys crocea]
MVDFKWILIALLQFTAAEGLPPSFAVRAGQEVTLPCENVIDGQQNCDSTTWVFIDSRQRESEQLIKFGQIDENAKSKSDRLSVTQKCSLVIKNVTHRDVGRYICQQWKSGQRQEPDSDVNLSVVTMTEKKNNDQVEWSCYMLAYDGQCRRTVQWLYFGNNVDKDKWERSSHAPCIDSVTFQSSYFNHTSISDLFKCKVTNGDKVQLFPFRLQPSGEKPGDDTAATTESSMKRGTITIVSLISDDSANLKCWWRFIIVPVGLAALIIIVVAVSMWTRTKGRKRQMDENMVDDDEDDGAVNYENVTSSV